MAKKNLRLQFTDAELNPKLRHHARRAGKTADQAERARAKLPKDKKKLRRRMTSQHMWPAAHGKRLYFAEVAKPKPPSKSCPMPSNRPPASWFPAQSIGR